MRRKIFLFGGGCFALLFILLVAFVLLLPHLVNLESVREKIEALLYEQVGGRVAYQKIDLFYFPRPGVKAHQVSVSIDEKVAGTVKSVHVYPELSALFKGKLRVARIEIESADVTILFPTKRPEVKEKPQGTALKELEEIVARVAGIIPRLKVVMKDGRLNLVRGSETVFSFNDIAANMTGSPRKPEIEITCRSNLWERMSAEATINPVDLSGHGHIEVASFRPHLLSHLLSPDLPLKVTDSELNLNLSFETKGQGMFQAALEGSISKLTFKEGSEEIVIRGKRFRSAFQMEEGRTDISLGELNLEYPRLTLSGRFKMDQKASLVLLEVQGREMDVTSTRDVTLSLAGKIPAVKTIFDIVREGRVPLIIFQSQGRRMSDLDDTERFSIRGNMLDGTISIPIGEPGGDREDFTLVKVAGDVVVSRGILEGKNVGAQWKNQQLQEGSVRVGLEGEDAPLHLEVGVETDLSILPPLLNRLSKDRAFQEEIARFRQLEGRAVGRLVVGESLKSIEVKADVQEVNLVARHDRIPYPVVIAGGAFSFDGKSLRLSNLSGKVGNSSFSDLTGGIGFEKEPSIEISSGNSVVSLEEIYPWLTAYESVRGALKNIQSVKGKVTLSGMKLSAPRMDPGKWDFETAGELSAIEIKASRLPGPIMISSGKFRATQKKFSFDNFQTKLLDASFNLEGTLDSYLQGIEKGDLDIRGSMTPKDIHQLSNLFGLKSKIPVRSPLSISEGHLAWTRAGDTSFKGNIAVKEGPQISLDVSHGTDRLRVNRLQINDGPSRADITLDLSGRTLGVTFSGELSEKTMDRIFEGYQFQDGWVQGDFQAKIDLDHPMQSTAQGKVKARDLTSPWEVGKPLEIREISLEAQKNRVSVALASITWGVERFTLSGDVTFSKERLKLDLDLSAGNIDLDDLEKVLGKRKKGPEKRPDLSVEANIRLKSESVKFRQYKWAPFVADISFGDGGAEVKIKKASLCGMDTPGVVKVSDNYVSLNVEPSFKGHEIESAFRCLLNHDVRATGTFELYGRIVAQGRPEDLSKAMEGNIEFHAKDGRINYALGLVRLVEFLNLTEIYRGKLPDVRKEGLPYDRIKIEVAFLKEKMIFKEWTLDGPTMEIVGQGEIDLAERSIKMNVLVAPLKTVDRIIKAIPLVRDILAGTLLVIPVKVQGDLRDPRVTALSPSAVGTELLGMMKRTLGLPFNVIEPFVHRKKEDSSEER